MECIQFASTLDGRIIHGYLTLPPGSDHKQPFPLVVVPHGGPWLRNVAGFNRENREVQFFANCGYAVLQMNFRGSFGYGAEFWKAGFKQWGRSMQQDVTDGVLEMIKRGIADRNHVAIVGESYGGYAALAGIAFTQGFQYAAAIDRDGISNLVTLVESYGDALLYAKVGDPKQDRAWLMDVSPELHANQIKTPLLIAHGQNDPDVSPFQSDRMVAALRRRGIAPIYLQIPNEGHIFENEENRITYYENVDRFLAEHLR